MLGTKYVDVGLRSVWSPNAAQGRLSKVVSMESEELNQIVRAKTKKQANLIEWSEAM